MTLHDIFNNYLGLIIMVILGAWIEYPRLWAESKNKLIAMLSKIVLSGTICYLIYPFTIKLPNDIAQIAMFGVATMAIPIIDYIRSKSFKKKVIDHINKRLNIEKKNDTDKKEKEVGNGNG